MELIVKGRIEKVFETQQVTDSFKKREFILLMDENNYPQKVKFEMIQDKVNHLDNKEGKEVTVKFNLKGREYTKYGRTMYFNTLQAWAVFIEQEQQQPQQQPSAPTNVVPPAPVVNDVKSDDLPF